MKVSVNGLVLAGGRSTRMGQDKAGMMHPDGQTLLQRTLDLMERFCERRFVSLRFDQLLPTVAAGHEKIGIIRDPAGKSVGPMTGICAAMRTAPEKTWLIVSCDLPRLDRETLTHLIDSIEPGEHVLAYRSEFDGLPEPLCALYGPGSLPLLEEAMERGFHCPRKVLMQNHCRLLSPVTARALENTNTIEEWANAMI